MHGSACAARSTKTRSTCACRWWRRLVQELGWDIWNPTEVYTEFKATKKEDNTRVDVALFTRDFEDTAIFIECKGVGAFAADLAAVERQLRDYNRDHTALFTIITDGRHWRFYFSFTSGEFKDKLFCKFDLQQDGLEEVAGYFDTFLRRDNITNHSARQKAEAYLMLGKKERAMQDVLPDAQKIVSQPPFPSLPEALVARSNGAASGCQGIDHYARRSTGFLNGHHAGESGGATTPYFAPEAF